jgi:hypothetical protein
VRDSLKWSLKKGGVQDSSEDRSAWQARLKVATSLASQPK